MMLSFAMSPGYLLALAICNDCWIETVSVIVLAVLGLSRHPVMQCQWQCFCCTCHPCTAGCNYCCQCTVARGRTLQYPPLPYLETPSRLRLAFECLFVSSGVYREQNLFCYHTNCTCCGHCGLQLLCCAGFGRQVWHCEGNHDHHPLLHRRPETFGCFPP